MTGVELIALSLGLSVGVAAAGALAAVVLERFSGDASLRERAWAAALYLSALPPVAVAAMLLTPAPVRSVAAMATPATDAPVFDAVSAALPPGPSGFGLDWNVVATAVLTLALLMIAARLISLAWRVGELNRLIARTAPASTETRAAVVAMARSLRLEAPSVRIRATGPDALLAGLVRPVLILPASLAGNPDGPAARAVITHELAHLKRGDHRAIWLEETLLMLLAFNPILPAIRARRGAAREEACDALALSGAEPGARRAYAQSLIEALRARTGAAPIPALIFTGVHRSQAMRRLKAILTPPAVAGRGTKLAALTAGIVVAGLTAAGSLAVAAQRPAQAVLDANAGAPPATRDHAYVGAALEPLYKVAWPGACGFGSEGDGQVFVHTGDGCAPEGGPATLILSLNGVSPSVDPRAAFVAVKTACDAGRPVEIAFSRGGERDRASVACAAPAVAPPEPVRFTVTLSYDPAIVIASGDRLEIDLRREVGEDGLASTGMSLDLAPGALPGQAFADLRPPLLPSDRSSPMFAMTARIVGAGGVVKAVSDRDLGRPHPPYLSGPDSISTAMRMLPVDAASTVGRSGDAAVHGEPALRPTPAARRQHGGVEVWMPIGLALDGAPPVLGPDEELRVAMADDARTTVAETVARSSSGRIDMPLTADRFPPLGGANRAYVLTAEIRRADGTVRAFAEPTTIRLAPGSRRAAANLRPVLTFGGR